MRVAVGLILLALAGCAQSPQMVMLNPRTGATVGCQVPDISAAPGDFLVSRACLSACEAHGFRPVPGARSNESGSEIPDACSN